MWFPNVYWTSLVHKTGTWLQSAEEYFFSCIYQMNITLEKMMFFRLLMSKWTDGPCIFAGGREWDESIGKAVGTAPLFIWYVACTNMWIGQGSLWFISTSDFVAWISSPCYHQWLVFPCASWCMRVWEINSMRLSCCFSWNMMASNRF